MAIRTSPRTEIKGKAVTVAGNVNTSSAKARFGATSAYFDGTGDYLSVAASNDFNFGTSDFTVEAWIKMTPRASSAAIIDYFKSNVWGWQLLVN